MIDTEFEKKSRDHAEGMPVVGGLWFVTWSPGFSNANEIPELSDEQIRTFNDRYLKYIREVAALQE